MLSYHRYIARGKGSQARTIYPEDPDLTTHQAKDHEDPERVRVVCKKQRAPQYVWVWPRKEQSDCYLGNWFKFVRGRGPVLHIKSRGSSKDCLHGHGPILQVARGTPTDKCPEPAPRLKKVEEAAKTEPRGPSSAASSAASSTGRRPNMHTAPTISSSLSGLGGADAIRPFLRGGDFALVDPLRGERVGTWVRQQRGGYIQEEYEDEYSQESEWR